MSRGALDLDLPEPHVLLDEETGAPNDVVRRAKDPGVKRAYQMIEELMLLANELVAQWLSSQKSVAVYRVHSTPDPAKLERVASVANKLGFELDPLELAEPKALGRWLRRIADHPKKSVLEMLTLRSLKQAVYDIVNVGHFGLASDAYLHFTSPIRRYPDLVVHRLVKALLRGGKPLSLPADVEKIRGCATESSQRERASMEVEREVVDLYRTLLMQDRVGQTFEGTVTGVTGTGVYVALDEPYVDVLVRFENLGADQYELSDDDLAVVGQRSGDRIELGSRLAVVIEEANITRRTTLARRISGNPSRAVRPGYTPATKGPKVQGRKSGGSGSREPLPRKPERGRGPRAAESPRAPSGKRTSPETRGKSKAARPVDAKKTPERAPKPKERLPKLQKKNRTK